MYEVATPYVYTIGYQNAHETPAFRSKYGSKCEEF